MDVQTYMQGIGKAARAASRAMAVADSHAKNQALTEMALAMERAAKVLLHENARDAQKNSMLHPSTG
jgi:glutamate-5-semialdehyde dehydrogenase